MIERTRALAALDLILSPEWESRCYSFNSRWSESEQMASMRNGSGDEWFILFSNSGWAALKGFDHESEACKNGEKIVSALREAIPKNLESFVREPAFSWQYTTFAYYCLSPDYDWQRANDKTPFSKLRAGDEWMLKQLVGSAEDYMSFAESSFEININLDSVASIFQMALITDSLVKSLNPDIVLSDISSELFDEIGYPN